MTNSRLFTVEMLSAAYQAILGRDLEPGAYEAAVASGASFSEMLINILSSNELKNKRAFQFMYEKANNRARLLQVPKVTLIQTADSINYRDLLISSAKYNSKYCSLFGIDYEMYIGLKFGVYPHHAMFNRIKMLQEYVRKGYEGWVFYLDADNLIQNRDYDFRALFDTLDTQGKFFLFYNHFSESDEKFEMWDINTGIFAVRIGNYFVNAIIESWNDLYENYFSSVDYEAFRKWGDYTNDQTSLRAILTKFDEILSIKEYCHFNDFSDHVIAWFGRAEEDPTLNDISVREGLHNPRRNAS